MLHFLLTYATTLRSRLKLGPLCLSSRVAIAGCLATQASESAGRGRGQRHSQYNVIMWVCNYMYFHDIHVDYELNVHI